MDSVCLRTAPTEWNVSVKLFFLRYHFFAIRKEPVAASTDVPAVQPPVSAETLKACALSGRHLLALEGEAGSGGRQSLI